MDSKSVPPPPAYSGPGYPAAQAQYGFPQYMPGSAIPGQQIAVTVQDQLNTPGPIIWMPSPPPIPKCPPGLEYLSQIDEISVQQQIELMEMISGFETCNRYEVKNPLGQMMYFAAEENDDFTLNMYGPLRSFTIKLFDSRSQPVMQLSRAFHCAICCCPCVCCLQEVKALDGKSTVGTISRQWTGFAREAATDASIFGIKFPMDLDIKMKAIVIGASFLLDFMFFERKGNRNRQGRTTGLHRAHRHRGAHVRHIHHRR